MGKFTSIPGNQGVNGSAGSHVLEDKEFIRDFPALWEYLTLAQDNGKVRATSTLLVFVQDGLLTLCLNDREENRSVFLGAPTLREAMVLMEEALSTGTAAWRGKPKAGGNSRR